MDLVAVLAGVFVGFIAGVLAAVGFGRQPDTGANGTMAACPRCAIKISALCTDCRAKNLAPQP